MIKKNGFRIKPTHYIILLFFLSLTFVNLNHHKWSGKDGVIVWDIKSYYAYLPATFIYHDLSLDFINKYPEKNLNDKVWRIKSPTGKRAIITTSGLSMMYAPFFFISHAYALLDKKYDADGYTKPYHVGLAFSALFYFIIALFLLRKILLKFVDEKATALTLLAVCGGTNLFYYLSYEAAMSHSYNFFLIILFTHLVIQWHEKPALKNSVFIGLVAGLIVLIRPTNIIALLLFLLYGVVDLATFKANIKKLFKNWNYLLFIGICLFLVWIPQIIYWHYISGKYFYFSYGDNGGKFFFNNPQISDFLISFKKGWYLYTPLMLISTVGIYHLYKTKNKFSIAISIILLLYIYILSSWWSWWFGGAFGQRSMIDIYGLLAIPLAVLIAQKRKFLITKILGLLLILVLIFYNQFQTQQYRRGSIHYWWMNKEAYFETFLKLKPTCKYWKIITIPDYDKARQGIYITRASHDKSSEIKDSTLIKEIIKDMIKTKPAITYENAVIDSLYVAQAQNIIDHHEAGEYFKRLKIQYYKGYINGCKTWRKEIERKAAGEKITYELALLNEANRVFETYSEKYEETFK
jgi:hypothetical protein